MARNKSYTRKCFEQLTGRMSIWNWCLSCCGWRPSKASTSAGSPWDRSVHYTVNKWHFIKKIECKEWSRTPPPSTNKKGGKIEKGAPGRSGEIEKGAPGRSGARRAWEGNQTGTLTRWRGLMGGKAPVGRSTCVKKLVLLLIVFCFRSVCLFVVGFDLYEWRNMVHTLVTWILTGSAENVGRWNEPGNRQSHVF